MADAIRTFKLWIYVIYDLKLFDFKAGHLFFLNSTYFHNVYATIKVFHQI